MNFIYLKRKSCKNGNKTSNDKECSLFGEDAEMASNKEQHSYKNELNLRNSDGRLLIKRDTKKEGYRGYGRWTKWTPCSRHCRTKRMR